MLSRKIGNTMLAVRCCLMKTSMYIYIYTYLHNSLHNSNVVYQFKYAGCSTCKTTTHISSLIEEHLKTNKQSYSYKHLQNKCNNKCFFILNYARTKFQLKHKQGMNIGWGNPYLNKQVRYVSSPV